MREKREGENVVRGRGREGEGAREGASPDRPEGAGVRRALGQVLECLLAHRLGRSLGALKVSKTSYLTDN